MPLSGKISIEGIMTMGNLRRFTFSYDRQNEDWTLRNDTTGRVVRRFDTKEEGTQGGVLSNALGSEGGSVRIEKVHGGYEEERTFPRSKDPSKSPG
jgi:hypothetical protein